MQDRLHQLDFNKNDESEITRETRKNVIRTTHTKNTSTVIADCDFLILSDSILRRIIPRKFTPKGRTLKRYIRGGAKTCTAFIEKYGKAFNPKNIIINIGTRDLQNSGIVNSEFNQLFEIAEKTWPNAKINILPIIYRQDMAKQIVDEANLIICIEGEKFKKVSLLNKFELSNEMFYDQVHLNNNQGLPALVKHLKSELKLYSYSNSTNGDRYTINRSFTQQPLPCPPWNITPFQIPPPVQYQQLNLRPLQHPQAHVLSNMLPPFSESFNAYMPP